MGQASDINTIECYVDLSDRGNTRLFDRFIINKLITDEISIFLQKNGINHIILEVGGKGGGGGGVGDELIHFLEFILRNGSLIAMVYATGKFIFNSLKKLFTRISEVKIKESPLVLISFQIRTNEYISNKDASELRLRLINLKTLSDSVIDILRNKYPFFKFDQMFSIRVGQRRFSISFSLFSEYQNNFNSLRLLNLFRNFKIRDNMDISYEFSRFMLITRTDLNLEITEKTHSTPPNKKYYFLFSSNIIGPI